MAKDNGKMESNQVILAIPLNKILVPQDWNARHKNHMLATPKPETDRDQVYGTAEGLKSIADSYEERGQDTAALVRPNPDPKTNKEKPYSLVCGFRRYAAIEMVAQKAVTNKIKSPIKADPTWDPTHPTINAVVRELTEAQAQLANIAENTLRDDLPYTDFAFSVARYMNQYRKETGKDYGGKSEIARMTGKDASYIGKLLEIMDGCPADIVEHWRASKAPATIEAMRSIAKLKDDPKKQRETYQIQTGEKAPNPATPTPPATHVDPLDAICERLEKKGIMLGRLHAKGIVDCTDTEWAMVPVICELTKVPNKTVGRDDLAKWKRLGSAAHAGFKRGIAEIEKLQAKKLANEKAGVSAPVEDEGPEDDDDLIEAPAN